MLVELGAKRHHITIGGVDWRAVGMRVWLCCNKGGQGERLGLLKEFLTVCLLYRHTTPAHNPQAATIWPRNLVGLLASFGLHLLHLIQQQV